MEVSPVPHQRRLDSTPIESMGSFSTSYTAAHPLEACSICGMTWNSLCKLAALLAALRNASIACEENGEKYLVIFELL